LRSFYLSPPLHRWRERQNAIARRVDVTGLPFGVAASFCRQQAARHGAMVYSFERDIIPASRLSFICERTLPQRFRHIFRASAMRRLSGCLGGAGACRLQHHYLPCTFARATAENSAGAERHLLQPDLPTPAITLGGLDGTLF
jgi:hypothetical protein